MTNFVIDIFSLVQTKQNKYVDVLVWHANKSSNSLHSVALAVFRKFLLKILNSKPCFNASLLFAIVICVWKAVVALDLRHLARQSDKKKRFTISCNNFNLDLWQTNFNWICVISITDCVNTIEQFRNFSRLFYRFIEKHHQSICFWSIDRWIVYFRHS